MLPRPPLPPRSESATSSDDDADRDRRRRQAAVRAHELKVKEGHDKLRREIREARVKVNAHYAALMPEIASELPSTVTSRQPMSGSFVPHTPKGPLSRPGTGSNGSSSKLVRVDHHSAATSTRRARVTTTIPPSVAAAPRATTSATVPSLVGVSTQVDDTPIFETETHQRARLVEAELLSWQNFAREAFDFKSIFVWGRSALSQAAADDCEHDDSFCDGSGSAKKITVVACTVLDTLMQVLCDDKALWRDVRRHVFNAIFVDFDESQTLGVPITSATNTVTCTKLAHYTTFFEALQQSRREIEGLHTQLSKRATALKSFGHLLEDVTQRAASKQVEVCFNAWAKFTRDQQRRRLVFTMYAARKANTRRLQAAFGSWKFTTKLTHAKRLQRLSEELKKQADVATATLTQAVNEGKEATMRELIKTRGTLAEERDMRERQFTAFTFELDTVNKQLDEANRNLDETDAERVLWRCLWKDVARASMKKMPSAISPILLTDAKTLNNNIKLFLQLHGPEGAATVAQRRANALTINDAASDGSASHASSHSRSTTTAKAPNNGAPLSSSSPPMSETVTPRQLEMARWECIVDTKHTLEKLVVNWVNHVLTELGVGRVVINMEEDLADGEVYLVLCAVVTQGSLEALTKDVERAFGIRSAKANLVTAAAKLQETMRSLPTQLAGYPVFAPLLSYCAYAHDQLREEHVLFPSAGREEWCTWLLSSMFVTFCLKQVALLDDFRGGVPAGPELFLDRHAWAVLSEMQMAETLFRAGKSGVIGGGGGSSGAGGGGRRKSIARRCSVTTTILRVPTTDASDTKDDSHHHGTTDDGSGSASSSPMKRNAGSKKAAAGCSGAATAITTPRKGRSPKSSPIRRKKANSVATVDTSASHLSSGTTATAKSVTTSVASTMRKSVAFADDHSGRDGAAPSPSPLAQQRASRTIAMVTTHPPTHAGSSSVSPPTKVAPSRSPLVTGFTLSTSSIGGHHSPVNESFQLDAASDKSPSVASSAQRHGLPAPGGGGGAGGARDSPVSSAIASSVEQHDHHPLMSFGNISTSSSDADDDDVADPNDPAFDEFNDNDTTTSDIASRVRRATRTNSPSVASETSSRGTNGPARTASDSLASRQGQRPSAPPAAAAKSSGAAASRSATTTLPQSTFDRRRRELAHLVSSEHEVVQQKVLYDEFRSRRWVWLQVARLLVAAVGCMGCLDKKARPTGSRGSRVVRDSIASATSGSGSTFVAFSSSELDAVNHSSEAADSDGSPASHNLHAETDDDASPVTRALDAVTHFKVPWADDAATSSN